MEDTFDGIYMDWSEVQSVNAIFPIEVTPEGMFRGPTKTTQYSHMTSGIMVREL
jgi:hypothetical protein